jgi:hypothetical protein
VRTKELLEHLEEELSDGRAVRCNASIGQERIDCIGVACAGVVGE